MIENPTTAGEQMMLVAADAWAIGLAEAERSYPHQTLAALGRRLKDSYDAVLAAPMPDSLACLVRRLEEAESGSQDLSDR
jgi:hypothetical protein